MKIVRIAKIKLLLSKNLLLTNVENKIIIDIMKEKDKIKSNIKLF